MPAIEREGDPNNGGAPVVSSAQKTVYANNIPVSVNGSAVGGHGKHKKVVTVTGSPDVYIDGVPVNRVGDKDSCGHVRISGSGDVIVNG